MIYLSDQFLDRAGLINTFMSKTISVYFQAVTKVSVGHLSVEDDVDIEDMIAEWSKKGYARVHYVRDTNFIYIPWGNIVYCQYDQKV